MDSEIRGIRTSNGLCAFACITLIFVTIISSGDLVSRKTCVYAGVLSVFICLSVFFLNMFARRDSKAVAVAVTLMLVYTGGVAAFFANSTMTFAVIALFGTGVAYFNRVRMVHLVHAGLTSSLLIICLLPIRTGTPLDTILDEIKQFRLLEVIIAIIVIVVTDGFFFVLNTGRARLKESLTEQEKSSDELMKIIEAKADEARIATKSKSDFLASMSHEIRTPINSILGMNEMILRETKEEDIRKYSEDIQHAGNMLLSLINNILDFSKIESGKMELIPVKYDLGMVLNDLKIFVANRAKIKGIDFNLKVSSDIPRTLYGDEIRIKQIITNILTNAVKYTDSGSVNLEMDFDKADERSILLTVSVTDTGRGMKKEDIEKLFLPFERIEELKNRHIEGTGLGMNIVQQLLALMGSKLIVKSEYGHGSVFSFTIRQEVIDWTEIGDIENVLSEARNAIPAEKDIFTAPDARILVVDDIKMNLNVIVGLLKRTKIKVDTALSGEEAIELAKKNEYDLVFIDHMMPEMDGIETLERMRKDRFVLCREKPMIALTANALSGAREFYLDKGFVDYLSKPVNSKLLENMIRTHLPRKLIATGGPKDSSSEDDIDC